MILLFYFTLAFEKSDYISLLHHSFAIADVYIDASTQIRVPRMNVCSSLLCNTIKIF